MKIFELLINMDSIDFCTLFLCYAFSISSHKNSIILLKKRMTQGQLIKFKYSFFLCNIIKNVKSSATWIFLSFTKNHIILFKKCKKRKNIFKNIASIHNKVFECHCLLNNQSSLRVNEYYIIWSLMTDHLRF